ncbi:MAG: hypothetical protein ACRCSG_04855 [Cellulosilyticaceae bacterium]
MKTKKYSTIIEKKINECKQNGTIGNYNWYKKNQDMTTLIGVKCEGVDNEKMIKEVSEIISDTVQEAILQEVSDKEIKQLKGFSEAELKNIKKVFKVNHFIPKEDGASGITYYKVYIPILHEVKEKNNINIDGWINFRMTEYRQILEELFLIIVADNKIRKKDLEDSNAALTKCTKKKTLGKILTLYPKDN